MDTYIVITAEVHGSLKTGIVLKEEFSGDASEYFVHDAQNPESHGTVEISGEAEHMIPSYVVEG